ncbi:hypothetical protein SH1V18_21880 [Vallitalea longa]|uniref:Methyltransferase type 11 domain-containing protein n=1 Tax=Vallitalea longa TaxID=2936439 RepID=A0A9W5YCB1_9FIRM|nr:class I SAM-dependent methyltransferase [Vallitalea longa]GKX29708.1 hypothetical protein SH1V18_21880 [Vallitalea longa]
MNRDKRIYKEKKIWDRLARRYDKQISIFNDAYELTTNKAKNILREDDNILEIACGTGIVSFGIADAVKKVTAIDISKEMIDVAKEKAKKMNVENIEFQVADGYNLQYEDNSFDTILLFNTLHIVKEPDTLLNEIYRLLKPNGYLLTVTDCYSEPVKIKTRLMLNVQKLVRILGIIPYLSYYRKENVDNYILKHNFKIMERYILNKEPVNYYVSAIKNKNL